MTTNLLNRSVGTKETFDLRKVYLSDIVPSSKYTNFYDSSLVHFYGKVDLDGNIIYPSEKFLSTLPNPNKKSGRTYYALNFVAKAFSDFRDYYLNGIVSGITKGASPMQVIEPIRGWESMHDIYAANIDSLYSVLINSYLQNPGRIAGIESAYPKDFDNFIRSTKHLFKAKGGVVKLSRSSFILSTHCPLSTTGLAIEINPKIDYSSDKDKNINFYDNPNFDFYMEALKKFGFMADIDYPGRLIADVGSPAMQEYMSEFGLTLDTLFETYYYKAENSDYDLIRIYLAQFYNSYVTDYPVKSIVKKRGSVHLNKYSLESQGLLTNNKPIPVSATKIICGKSERDIIQRNKIDPANYSDSYWLTTCIEMLNYELRNPLNEHNLSKVIKNAQDLKKSIDIDRAKCYINEVFNKFRYPANITQLANYKYDTKTKTK